MIYVFLAEGFEEVEALTPVDTLRRAGKTVKTVGVGSKTVSGAHGIPVVADLTENEIALDTELEMVVLPGGMPGTLNLEKSSTVQKAVRYAAENGRFVAAICAAPSVLGHMGLLAGKAATCYPGFESELTGAKPAAVPAVRDGNFITGRGPGAAMDFALLLAETLCGKEKSEALASGMVYKK